MLSIYYLYEETLDTVYELNFILRGPGKRSVRRGIYNAPMFAWSVYNDGDEPPFIQGRATSHASIMWNGINIDAKIPIDSIKELNAIPEIEARSSCQGHIKASNIPDINTYFIFRPKNQNQNYIRNLVDKLNNIHNIKSGYGLGEMNQFRIAIVAPFSYDSNPKEFRNWWGNLPRIIKNNV